MKQEEAYNKFYHLLMCIAGKLQDSEDLVQETFMDVFQKKKFADMPLNDAKNLLCAVLKNKIKKYFRRYYDECTCTVGGWDFSNTAEPR